jgi:tetratricopeptide (TPR) repeat protein
MYKPVALWRGSVKIVYHRVIPALCFGLLLLASPALAEEVPSHVDVVSVGMGFPPAGDAAATDHDGIPSALSDAKKKAVLSYLFDTLGEESFLRWERPIDFLILSDYEAFILDTRIVSEEPLPDSGEVIIKAVVTLDSRALSDQMNKIAHLEPEAPAPRSLSGEEKEVLRKKAQERLVQADVAADVLLDHVRGIESYLSAKNLFEMAEDQEGIYRCLMGLGRARMAIAAFSDALSDFNRAREIAMERGNEEGVMLADMELATLLFLMGDYVNAETRARMVFDRASASGPSYFSGRCRALLGEIAYVQGDRERAEEELRGALSVFKNGGEVKRYHRTHLLLACLLGEQGKIDVATMELKRSIELSETLEDEELRVLALIALGRLTGEGGDMGGARIYLTEAVTRTQGIGWIIGEFQARLVRGELFLEQEKYDEAAADIERALELARLSESPSLMVAALSARGRLFLEAGKKNDALDTLSAAIAAGSDIRALRSRTPLTIVDEERLVATLSTLLFLSDELGKEEVGFRSLLTYQTGWVARRIYAGGGKDLSSSGFETRRGELLSHWKDAAGEAIAAESIWLDPETNSVSGSSLSALMKNRKRIIESYGDVATTITEDDPRLSTLLGGGFRDPKNLIKLLPADALLVRYFVGTDAVFALVTTAEGFSIKQLGIDPLELTLLLDAHMDNIHGKKPSTPAAGEQEEGEEVEGNGEETEGNEEKDPAPYTPPDFEDTSHRLSRALVTPVVAKHPEIKKIGVSPGIVLSRLPFFSLGEYTEAGEFYLLTSQYELFYASSFFTEVVNAPLTPPAVDRCIIVGDGEVSSRDLSGLFSETETAPSPREAVRGGDVLVVYNESVEDIFNEADIGEVSILAIILKEGIEEGDDQGDISGGALFRDVERVASLGPGIYFFFPEGIGADEASQFIGRLVVTIRERGAASGLSRTAREYMERSIRDAAYVWTTLFFTNNFWHDEEER